MERIGAMLLRRAVLLSAAVTVGLLVQTGVASAASFTVTTTNDLNDGSCTASVCSLRDAVVAADTAGGASTITVPAGTYKLTIASTGADDPTTGDLDINNDASVTINGDGSGSTIIDANHIDRAFAVQSGASLSISAVTIENGASLDASPSDHSTDYEYGGAIYNDGTLSVTNSTLDHNEAYGYGGAIYAGSGAVSTTVSGSDVSYDNVEEYYGGGIEVDAGNMSVSNTTVDHDAANDYYDGGLVWDSTGVGSVTNSAIDYDSGYYAGGLGDYASGSLAVSGSDISHDSGQSAYTESSGGGIYYDGSGSLSVTGSSISDDADGFGAGVYLAGTGAVTLSQDTLADDSATYYEDSFGGGVDDENGAGAVTMSADTFDSNSGTYGAAVYFEGTSEQLTNDTFDGNSGYYGASIYLEKAGATLLNDTIAHGNGVEGGGIYKPDLATAITNTIVADNQGGDCYDGPAGTSTDKGNNLDSDSTCFGTTPESSGDLVSTDPDLGSLANNGGPTETDALLAGSPAIGGGNNALCPSTDQRGVPRPQGANCDIGAFEAAAANLTAANGAPSSADTNAPFTYTITTAAGGPGPSTGTTITDQLPAGETLYGATPSQGSCSSSGSPAQVICDLGVLDAGTSASVALVVTEANAGSVTDTATVSNDQGASVSGSATTKLTAPVAPAGATKPKATTSGTSNRNKHNVKLTGKVSTGGQPTTYFFQFGRKRSLGSISGLVRLTGSKSVKLKIQSLAANTKYYFRIVAINDSGTSYGATKSFRTKK